jgi:hypothetical protein
MGAPSSTAIRNGDDRDATSRPSDACAVAVAPSPGQAPSPEWAPNRERPPNRERATVPTAIRNGDDRDPTSKPSGACAVPVDPSPGQVPNRDRAPNREQATVPTTALEPRGQTVCRLDPDREGPASPPRPR